MLFLNLFVDVVTWGVSSLACIDPVCETESRVRLKQLSARSSTVVDFNYFGLYEIKM